MLLHKVQQGTSEWFALRAGVITSSCFSKIVTPVNGTLSKQAEKHIYRTAWEIVSGESAEIPFDNYWMERGALLEQDARALYEFDKGVELHPGGFITSDDGWLGCSPDALIFDGDTPCAAVEIKCPAPWTHIENMLRGGKIDPQYRPQVQGQILVGELDYVDWFSYHPDMPSVCLREVRDQKYQENLQEGLTWFVDELQKALARLEGMGVEIASRCQPKEEDVFRYMRV